MTQDKTERIAKVIARSGYCSRRKAEHYILESQVSVNGKIISTPATLVGPKDQIAIKGEKIQKALETTLWKFYKPRGVLTSASDPEGRATIMDYLGKEFSHVITVGRLDYNSEGLLLITNDGELARFLEHPSSEIKRTYKVRVRGKVDPKHIENLKNGITINKVKYRGIDAEIMSQTPSNAWLKMNLYEGKNREIRKIMEHFGWPVSRLVRIGYGQIELDTLQSGQIKKIPQKILKSFEFKRFFEK